MVEWQSNPDVDYDAKIRRHLQVLYSHETREKQIFLNDLKEYRKLKDKQMLHRIIGEVGPKWYQALSVPQRSALDSLRQSIYQDLLEGRPHRTAAIMHKLGLVPRPTNAELMNCLYLGRNDPKEMLAQLYLSTYGYPIEGKQMSYCLNAKIMLSSILYLGLDDLIVLLQNIFAPDPSYAGSELKRKRSPGKPKLKSKLLKPKPQKSSSSELEEIISPYLMKIAIAVMYEPPRLRRLQPLPLPTDLTELDEPYEEEPIIQKPPPPPPPPPPPKKKIPKAYCDELAGIPVINGSSSPPNIPPKKPVRVAARAKVHSSKTNILDGELKKSYGLNFEIIPKKIGRRRKPVAPTTGLWNTQYTINGVFQIHGRTSYVLGNVVVLPAQGDLIHGGHSLKNGEYINIHCGFRGRPPSPTPEPCDCVEKWEKSVLQYVKDKKCRCGHNFDFDNEEGSFPSDVTPYFEKPTRNTPFQFNYDRIFDMDPTRTFIEEEFKKVWDTDSMLRVDPDPNEMKSSKKKKKKKSDDVKSDRKKGASTVGKETKRRYLVTTNYMFTSGKEFNKGVDKAGIETQNATDAVSTETKKDGTLLDGRGKTLRPYPKRDNLAGSGTADDDIKKEDKEKTLTRTTSKTEGCLGHSPKPQDYLRCALRLLRKANIAARLPDLHLVPELIEWMRKRLYGSLTVMKKKEYLRKSTTYWRMFTSLESKGFGHIGPPKEPMYRGHTTWMQKQTLTDTFKEYTYKYRLALFRSHAYITNLLWRSMYQAEFPDKNFREIYFSYLVSHLEDVQLLHPYSMRESIERKIVMSKKRYICLPAGYEPKS